MSKNVFMKEVNKVAEEIPVGCTCPEKHVTTQQKWMISLLSGILFAIVSMPLIYKTTNKVLPGILDENGMPTMMGVIVHSIVFLLLTRLIMRP